MSSTLANLEAALMPMVHAKLARVSLDATTITGTNGDLAGPLRRATIISGLSLVSPYVLTNTDLIGLLDALVPQVLDVAKLYVYELCLGELIDVDLKEDDYSEMRDQLAKRWQAGIDAQRAWVATLYGIGLPSISPSVLRLGFVATSDDSTLSGTVAEL
jgi:hypothetical protein